MDKPNSDAVVIPAVNMNDSIYEKPADSTQQVVMQEL